MVTDARNRPLRDLRISLTDRCNMRCRYCMPREHFDEHKFLAKKEILSYEELALIVESLVPLGLTKVRLTGGEPLLRRDVCSFIKMLPKPCPIQFCCYTIKYRVLLRFYHFLILFYETLGTPLCQPRYSLVPANLTWRAAGPVP